MRHSQNSGLHPRALGLGHQALTSGLPLAVDLTYQIKQPLFYVKVGYYQLHGAMNKERKRETTTAWYTSSSFYTNNKL
jgi:hypothetical protein